MRLKAGKLNKNMSMLNTYAPDISYEFNEIKTRGGIVDNSIRIPPRNLIKCWRTDNNGQPKHTNGNQNFIGGWTL